MLGERVIERSVECPVTFQIWSEAYLKKQHVNALQIGKVSSTFKYALIHLFFNRKIARSAGGRKHCSPLTVELIQRCKWALDQLEKTGKATTKVRRPQAKVTSVPLPIKEVMALHPTLKEAELAQKFIETVGDSAECWADMYVYCSGNAFGKALELIDGQPPHVRAEAVSRAVVNAFITAVARLLPLGSTNERMAEQVIAEHIYFCLRTTYGREWRRIVRRI